MTVEHRRIYREKHPTEPKIGVRIPLPDRVRAHTDEHLDGTQCVVLVYPQANDVELAEALRKGRDAIRRGAHE